MTFGIVSLVTLIAFEALAVSTAMPVAARALGGVREYGLAFSLFLTMSLLGIVCAGGWADRRGPAGPALTGLVLFTAGLIVSGTAGSFPMLLLGRAVSGTGGGLQVVSLYVVVAAIYPRALQPRVFGAISAAWVLPSIVGPPIAGWMAVHLSWRAVFLVVPPVLLGLLPLLWRLDLLRGLTVPGAGTAAAPRVRSMQAQLGLGAGLAGGALGLQAGMQGLGPWGGALLGGAGLLALLFALPPLLPPGTLRLAHGLASVIVVRAMICGTYFGAETFLPLMLVDSRGLSPEVAGLTLTSGAIGWAAGSWLQGGSGVPVRRTALLAGGALLIGVCVLALAAGPFAASPIWLVAPVWAVSGLGMGLATSSTSVLVLRLSSPGEEGRNSAALQVGDALGGVVGIGAAGGVFAALHQPQGDDSGVFALVWGILGAMGVLAAAVALRARAGPGDERCGSVSTP